MNRAIVLGRFQPFHNGHASLVMKASALHPEQRVMIAIGSAQSEWEPNNPWSAEERSSMIQAWADSHNIEVEICMIEDINDPPNWVEHARTFHGDGTLVTSDKPTSILYNENGLKDGESGKQQRCFQQFMMTTQFERSWDQVYPHQSLNG